LLSVDVVGLVKVKKEKKKGGFRVFGSPADHGEETAGRPMEEGNQDG
jgi:hypothetical protein